MHARELVELAALVATHASEFVGRSRSLLDGSIERYWSASKYRLDRWQTALHDCGSQTPQELSLAAKETQRRAIRPVLEEILTGEALTRVWTAVGASYDRRRGACELEPVLRSVFTGHLQARHRALNLMVFGDGFGVQDAVALNRLRRRTERWTDLLLGRVMLQHDVAEFAFDAERARHFADDLRHSSGVHDDPFNWQLVLASLRAAFQEGLSGSSPNADLNRRIASSVLSCLSQELSDSTALRKSLWLERLCVTASDTQMMIEELLALDAPLA